MLVAVKRANHQEMGRERDSQKEEKEGISAVSMTQQHRAGHQHRNSKQEWIFSEE